MFQNTHQPIPWKAIATSLPFWAIMVAHFSENWGFYTLLTELPSYLKHSLKFDLAQVWTFCYRFDRSEFKGDVCFSQN